ncbi:LacI family DNA-binding transcriptional regulator [Arthrobacter rhizosphaerae]|uniref:LacI family DNA-binding transcriptional regulator n=1 Tax=Arthrobacter rhizosphaerae TaxID=2855490 RepID=UPI001FF432D4|nr:LacI family DNA-binding transcriptional regulator [Arthrobacter rhizosphaerae]
MNEADTTDKSSASTVRKAPATIYDVARQTGVNASTVSRALNKPGRVNARTEQRIREAAEALNYRTNPMARALPTGLTDTVGLVMSDITNPVYFDLVRGAGRVCAAEGYTLVLAESQESPDLEAQSARRLLSSVDGLVLVGTRLRESDIRGFAEIKPVLIVNRLVLGIPSVVPDVVPGIRHALEHLSDLGHRSVAYLSGPSNSWMNELRCEIIFDEALKRGMSVVEIGPGLLPTVEGGHSGLRRVRAAGVTAVVAYNDLMAIGLLTACQEANVSVPDELNIVGFDDIFGSSFTSPPMTTIRTPVGIAGEDAIRRIIEIVRGHKEPPTVELATSLVLRGSTGRISQNQRQHP